MELAGDFALAATGKLSLGAPPGHFELPGGDLFRLERSRNSDPRDAGPELSLLLYVHEERSDLSRSQTLLGTAEQTFLQVIPQVIPDIRE